MANFAVSGVPVPVFVPNPSAHTPSVTIYNSGPSTIFLGGSAVSAATGLLLCPQAEISFPKVLSTIWAVGATGVTGTGTTLTANVAAGSTVAAVTSSGNWITGNTIVIGISGAAETVIISTLTGGTGVSFTTPTDFDHISGGTVALVNAAQGTNLNVTALSV
jgi:hypothetical protein